MSRPLSERNPCAICDPGQVADLDLEGHLLAGACLAIRSIRVSENGIEGPLCQKHAMLIVQMLAIAHEDDDGAPAGVHRLVAKIAKSAKRAAAGGP